MWPFSKNKQPAKSATPSEPKERRGAFLTHGSNRALDQRAIAEMQNVLATQPASSAMDGAGCGIKNDGLVSRVGEVPEQLLAWYATQRFIGFQLCAVIAQHWLVDKACTMPAADAFRHGFEFQAYSETGSLTDEQKTEIDENLRRCDKRHKLTKSLVQFARFGRIFGLRIAFFKVRNAAPDYYEHPFNIDSVRPGTYEGIVQVDPYWCSPLLSVEAASDPTSPYFYEPEWWIIQGRKFHRSHLVIFRTGEVPDILKPLYLYGGVSVPQRVYERVYAAERTANEAPQLAMTKRTIVQNTDLTAFYAQPTEAAQHMEHWAYYRDNYGIKLADSDDQVTQHDTSLADLDAVIMSQYQIVAAIAGVPATKLLGTTPKGFNATGEHESLSYHEELESIQFQCTELVDRHHALLLRSEIEPRMRLPAGSLRLEVDWNPVDSPTAREYAEINKINAETDTALVNIGALDALDVRQRLRSDNSSGYTDLSQQLDPLDTDLSEVDDLLGGSGIGEESAQSPAIDNPA